MCRAKYQGEPGNIGKKNFSLIDLITAPAQASVQASAVASTSQPAAGTSIANPAQPAFAFATSPATAAGAAPASANRRAADAAPLTTAGPWQPPVASSPSLSLPVRAVVAQVAPVVAGHGSGLGLGTGAVAVPAPGPISATRTMAQSMPPAVAAPLLSLTATGPAQSDSIASLWQPAVATAASLTQQVSVAAVSPRLAPPLPAHYGLASITDATRHAMTDCLDERHGGCQRGSSCGFRHGVQMRFQSYCKDWCAWRAGAGGPCCPRGAACNFQHPHRRIVALTDCPELLKQSQRVGAARICHSGTAGAGAGGPATCPCEYTAGMHSSLRHSVHLAQAAAATRAAGGSGPSRLPACPEWINGDLCPMGAACRKLHTMEINFPASASSSVARRSAAELARSGPYDGLL